MSCPVPRGCVSWLRQLVFHFLSLDFIKAGRTPRRKRPFQRETGVNYLVWLVGETGRKCQHWNLSDVRFFLAAEVVEQCTGNSHNHTTFRSFVSSDRIPNVRTQSMQLELSPALEKQLLKNSTFLMCVDGFVSGKVTSCERSAFSCSCLVSAAVSRANTACFPPRQWLMLSGHPNMTVVEEIWIPLREDGDGSFAKFFYLGAGKLHQAAPHGHPRTMNWFGLICRSSCQYVS